MTTLTSLARAVLRALARASDAAGTRSGGDRRSPDRRQGTYPGDYDGAISPVYSPNLDGDPDPGEVVWTWVPFEEDHRRGKDRPVLLVGRDGPWLLGLMLSTRDHDERPAGHGEEWLDVGTGAWDGQGRPSEVRLDRVVRIDPDGVRREGAVLDRGRFDEVARSLGRRPGW